MTSTGPGPRPRTTWSTARLYPADPKQTKILAKWQAIAGPLAAQVVGSNAEDITRRLQR